MRVAFLGDKVVITTTDFHIALNKRIINRFVGRFSAHYLSLQQAPMYENRMMPLGRKSSLVFALSAIFPLLHPTSVSLALDPEPQEPHGKANVIGEYIAETGFYQSMRLTEDAPIVSTRSKYQDITVVESDYYGKILVLDGVVQLTEKDADSYNEMMAHIPMMSHNAPSRVLVIGGGDGYVLSEVLKHPMVEHVDHVDLDEGVISVCRDYFSWGKAWDDPRVKLHVADGAAFIRDAEAGSYDVIIQDSSDPFTWDDDGAVIDLPSGVLYSQSHFENLVRVLSPGGALNLQAETFQIPSDLKGIGNWRSNLLDAGFKSAKYGSLAISSYPTGQIGFMLCKKSPEDNDRIPTIDDVVRRFGEMVRKGKATSYYQPKLQLSSFDLPLWVENSIYGESILSQWSTESDEL